MCSCATIAGTRASRPRTEAQTLEPNRCAWTTSTRSRRRSSTRGRQASRSVRRSRSIPTTLTPASRSRASRPRAGSTRSNSGLQRVRHRVRSKRSGSSRIAPSTASRSPPPGRAMLSSMTTTLTRSVLRLALDIGV